MKARPGLRAAVRKRLADFSLEVNLACAPGELVALVGPSGAGKTTLLRCLAGLEIPDGGDIQFNGRAWSRGRRILCRPQQRGVGLLAQDAPLFPHMTVLGNVEFALNPGDGGPGPGMDALALLDELGVAHLAGRRPHEISGGERQRAALAQVLARRPRLLLLDEPFSALDVENRLALRQRLLALRDAGAIPILHVTHDLAEARALATRMVSLRRGREDPAWLARQMEFLAREQGAEGGSPAPAYATTARAACAAS